MLSNLKIGMRLSIGFGVLLTLMFSVGFYGIFSIQSLHKDIVSLVEDRMVKVDQANNIMHSVNIIARALRNIIIDNDKNHQTDELTRIAESRKIVGDLFEKLSKSIRMLQ